MAMTKKEKNRKSQECKNYSYNLRRRVLIKALGGKCEACGSIERLELDHKNEEGREWCKGENIRIGRMQRLKLYEEDYCEDKLRVLCRSCNAKDGMHRMRNGVPHPEMRPLPDPPKDGIPF